MQLQKKTKLNENEIKIISIISLLFLFSPAFCILSSFLSDNLKLKKNKISTEGQPPRPIKNVSTYDSPVSNTKETYEMQTIYSVIHAIIHDTNKKLNMPKTVIIINSRK